MDIDYARWIMLRDQATRSADACYMLLHAFQLYKSDFARPLTPTVLLGRKLKPGLMGGSFGTS